MNKSQCLTHHLDIRFYICWRKNYGCILDHCLKITLHECKNLRDKHNSRLKPDQISKLLQNSKGPQTRLRLFLCSKTSRSSTTRLLFSSLCSLISRNAVMLIPCPPDWISLKSPNLLGNSTHIQLLDDFPWSKHRSLQLECNNWHLDHHSRVEGVNPQTYLASLSPVWTFLMATTLPVCNLQEIKHQHHLRARNNPEKYPLLRTCLCVPLMTFPKVPSPSIGPLTYSSILNLKLDGDTADWDQ